MPTKVKRNNELIEDDEFANVIMTHVTKEKNITLSRPDPQYSDFELAQIPKKFSYKKAMGPANYDHGNYAETPRNQRSTPSEREDESHIFLLIWI